MLENFKIDLVGQKITTHSNESNESSRPISQNKPSAKISDNLHAPRLSLGDIGPLEIFCDTPTVVENLDGKAVGFESTLSSSKQGSIQARAVPNSTSDWRTFLPPRELLNLPPGTSVEIESIIEASIEKLQVRVVEEILREQQRNAEEQAARARQDELRNGSAGRLVKGKERMIPTNLHPLLGGTTPPELQSPSRSGSHMSDATALTTSSSQDSGYVSATTDGSTPTKWTFGVLRPRIVSIFRRKGRLNREPISQQSSTPVTSFEECVSCLDDFDPKHLVPLSCHFYCQSCFTRLIETSMSSETSWPPKCCLNEIPQQTIVNHLSMKLQLRYRNLAHERSIPVYERIYCSKSSCASWIPPRSIDKSVVLARCPSCRHKTCTICRDTYHSTGECPDDPNLRATLRCAIDEGWRRCYSCRALVEHNQGCLHMTCRCKAQFCYVCGDRWHTCNCTDQQLAGLLTAAAARRQAAQVQEDVQNQTAAALEREAEAARAYQHELAEELREILQLIDEFELEEATRLAEEAEAERIRALALRRRREEERVRVIGRHFHNLHEEIDFLHSMQRIAMLDRYEFESKIIMENEAACGEVENIKKNPPPDLGRAESDTGGRSENRIPAAERPYSTTKETVKVSPGAKEEQLKVAQDADRIWLREVKRVREDMLLEMAMVEYQRLEGGLD